MKTWAKTFWASLCALGIASQLSANIEQFPITITCTNSDKPDEILNLSLNPLKNIAVLDYKAEHLGSPLSLSVGDVSGIYSSSYVSIESRSYDPLTRIRKLNISANMREVYRVTDTKWFSMSFLVYQQTGIIKPQELTYDSGVEEFDNTAPIFLVFDNSNLRCEIVGL